MPPPAIAAVSPGPACGAQWDWRGQRRRLGLGPRARLGPGWGGGGSVAWRDPCIAGDGGASRESRRWGRLGGRGGKGREALGGARGAWRSSAPLSLLPPRLIPGTDAPGSRVGARLPQLFGRKLWSGVTRSSPGPGGRGRAIEWVFGQNGFSQTLVRATRSPNALALPSLQPRWCAIPGRARDQPSDTWGPVRGRGVAGPPRLVGSRLRPG